MRSAGDVGWDLLTGDDAGDEDADEVDDETYEVFASLNRLSKDGDLGRNFCASRCCSANADGMDEDDEEDEEDEVAVDDTEDEEDVDDE